MSGVECDEDLVASARRALAENQLAGEVVLGDVFEFPLDDADVIFTYLAPATLQRLVAAFQSAAPGTRLVTVDFEVPGLVPVTVEGQNHVYALPSRVAAPGEVGWTSAGALVAVTPDRHSLTCLSLRHAGGKVTVTAAGSIEDAMTVAVGADRADAGQAIAVDLRWEELEIGTFVHGSLRCRGTGAFPLFAFVTEEDEGLWEVSDEGVARLVRRLRKRWEPASFAELLAACDGD